MKKIALALLLMAFSFSKAQYFIEDFADNEFFGEVGSTKIEFKINDRLEYYRLKYSNPQYAIPQDGEKAFIEALHQGLSTSIGNDQYAINGTFIFKFAVNEDGQTQ